MDHIRHESVSADVSYSYHCRSASLQLLRVRIDDEHLMSGAKSDQFQIISVAYERIAVKREHDSVGQFLIGYLLTDNVNDILSVTIDYDSFGIAQSLVKVREYSGQQIVADKGGFPSLLGFVLGNDRIYLLLPLFPVLFTDTVKYR